MKKSFTEKNFPILLWKFYLCGQGTYIQFIKKSDIYDERNASFSKFPLLPLIDNNLGWIAWATLDLEVFSIITKVLKSEI